MRHAIALLTVLAATTAACQRPASTAPAPAAAPPVSQPATSGPVGRPKAVTPPDALASQNTNWGSTVADVLEFRRTGNVLTVVGRFRNTGLVSLHFATAYVLDEAQGRKYKVLADEAGELIACCHGVTALGENQTLNFWVKFPAPPADVKAVTLVLPETTPFENLAIRD